MTKDKTHWYDGWIYDTFIAPNQDKIFRNIKKIIEVNSKLIDVGCGTGRFSFSVADKCDFVLGIDLSIKNIKKAKMNLSKKPIDNISFDHSGVNELVLKGVNHFDYAILTYVLHEVDEADRVNLLIELSQITDKIIIGDYLVPMPNGLSYWFTNIVEFFAGKEHFNNYKNYKANGGIYYLAGEAGLKINYEIKNQHSSTYLAVLSK